MPCQILVTYTCGTGSGEVVFIAPESHVWGSAETLENWIALDPVNNSRDNWHRHFTVLKITDKTPEEMAYLQTLHSDKVNQKWYFATPTIGEPAYSALNMTGEITCPWSVAEAYIRERV